MSEERSRTEYSAMNTTVAIGSRMVAILMGFATRVVFTHTLSEAYVGINGLFTDILNVLSLSELGVGTAITFSLYGPIARGDEEKQKSLMKLYQTIYRVVALIVLAAGLGIIPFMDLLIKNQPDVEHLTIIYLMYLGNSVISYLLVYKRTLIDAHQKLYVGILYQTIFLVIQDVVQIFVLIFTKNFILFLTIYIICTLGTNLAISWRADNMYPFLKEGKVQPLEKQEKREIARNIKAMLMHKIGTVVINNTDNLILSAFVGIVSVGCYSNYYLVIGSVRQVLDQIFLGITASVGNLGVTEESSRVKRIFEISFFIGQWLYGWAAICLFELVSPFVELSFGKKYLFSSGVVFVICLQFYLMGLRKATQVFRDSLGLFWFDRYKAVVEAVLNLVFSLCFVQIWGICGIFLGTVASTAVTSMWVEPYVLYKKRLHAPVRRYFLHLFLYMGIMVLALGITDGICREITGNPWQVLLLRLPVCVIIPNVFLIVVYWKKKEFQSVLQKAGRLIKSRKKSRTPD